MALPMFGPQQFSKPAPLKISGWNASPRCRFSKSEALLKRQTGQSLDKQLRPPCSPSKPSFQRTYIRLATESARLQPVRSPLASSRLARSIVAENVDCSAFGPASRTQVLAADQVARQPTVALSIPRTDFPRTGEWRLRIEQCLRCRDRLEQPKRSSRASRKRPAPLLIEVLTSDPAPKFLNLASTSQRASSPFDARLCWPGDVWSTTHGTISISLGRHSLVKNGSSGL